VVFSIFARLLAIAEVEQLVGPNKRRLFQEIVSVGALLIAWDLKVMFLIAGVSMLLVTAFGFLQKQVRAIE